MSSKKQHRIFFQGPIPAQKIADDIQKHAAKTNIGAHSIFLGQVRADELNGEKVVAIEYTAYELMVEEKMAVIREQFFEKYALTCMHIYHSLGRVAVGEICLFVFTSSAHRRDAIDACSEMVETIKKELPIWGKEICTNQSTVWKQNN
ncbi:molybdenum cofactor biosynthesis protein MoaE [Sediminibacterium sp. C3]|uniref:molybdenum cofactor biosynthesis protein MoaE n=1 Tax=Sediminibacterium sp. C3 TaxID=1267211 RepID=UPI0004161F2B|nr:molybdenum cofactor biosynthesis protein MoaE [Sediminibacterium sp. C3]